MDEDPRVQSVLRYWHEAWSQGRVEVLGEFYAATYRENDQELTPESFAGGLLQWREKFPDFRADVDRVWTTSDAVITRVIYSGTHRGDFTFLQATGRAVRASGLDVFEFDTDGKVAQHWHETDHWVLFEQLGVKMGQS
ncbi:MAG: hypothetical protein DLM58_12805 [Pseudonocardiales bacterium]|nr:MAG: hypothetical protein DLM58_12805 [Pseudonocardiales bacterium]